MQFINKPKSILTFLLTYKIFLFAEIHNPIFITSIPKCGTHLLIKTINLITKNESEIQYLDSMLDFKKDFLDIYKQFFFAGHLLYNNENTNILKKFNFKTLFIYRDPRDEALSFVYWIYKNPNFWPQLQKMTFNELLSYVITTETPFWYKSALSWKNEKTVYTTTFEKLIGPKGGGELKIQINEIKNIAGYIEMQITNEEAEHISNRLFGKKLITFREGQIGSWKKHFTEEHKQLFKEKSGQLLIDLEYEKDLNW